MNIQGFRYLSLVGLLALALFFVLTGMFLLPTTRAQQTTTRREEPAARTVRYRANGAPFQKCRLQTEGAGVASLSISIDGMEWRRVDSFAGCDADDEVYIVIQDENNDSWIQFGDGITGARPPSGAEVTCTYNYGSGTRGNVEQETVRPTLPVISGVALRRLAGQQQVWFDRAGLEYVYIPPGTFLMGCVPGDEWCEDNELPRHQVTITRGFWMGRTEVTVRAYMQFCEETGRSMPPEPVYRNNNLNPGWEYLDHPMVNVRWHDAVAYCEWAGVRLPAEAEWEYAARGGHEGRIYFWGNDRLPIVDGLKQANVRDETRRRAHLDLRWRSEYYFEGYDDGYDYTSPVGLFAANGFGLYDTAGNVWEWCSDWYNSSYYSTPDSLVDPQGPSSGESNVLRGGSWQVDPGLVRLSVRSWERPYLGNSNIGFRCVRDVD